MRRSRVVNSYLGVLALTSACATSSGTMSGSRYDVSPAPDRREFTQADRDSVHAQAVADREGPSVSIRAELDWSGNSRLIRGHFTLDQDAYVVVGQIDPQGVVRFLFPTNPTDDGFVRGEKSYTTNESFAGFESEFNFRQYQAHYTTSSYAPYSYDRGVGYMFVIASWRPMHFDQMAGTSNAWDSFEIADDSYLRDPRPAVYELASLLAETNREAYTVKFATYYGTTVDGFGSYGFAGNSAFNSSFCPGSSAFGFMSSPFNRLGFNGINSWGESFFYRGSYYAYDSAMNCYDAGGFSSPFGYRGFGNGYGYGYIASGPIPRVPAFGFGNAGVHRSPLNPHPTQPPVFLHPKATPGIAVDASERHLATAEQPHYNPQYRSRGLKTDDDPSTNPAGNDRRAPRIGGNGFDASDRPTISQMVNRRADSQNESRDWSRTTRISNDAASGTMRQGWAQRTTQNEGRNSNADNQSRGMRTDVSGRSSTPRQNGNGDGQRRSNGDGGARNTGGGNSGSGGGARAASPSGGQRSGGGGAPPSSGGGRVSAPASAPAPASTGASKP
jgi:hypothetical protein